MANWPIVLQGLRLGMAGDAGLMDPEGVSMSF